MNKASFIDFFERKIYYLDLKIALLKGELNSLHEYLITYMLF